MATALGMSFLPFAAAQPADRLKQGPAVDFSMAAYLEELSAKGKAAGYKEVVYKQTPQGELRMYLALPEGWSTRDCRPAVVYFFGGGWTGGNVFSFDEQSEYMAKCGVVGCMADYRVRSRHGVTLDKCVEDARSAVRFLRAHAEELGIDPNRIIAGGGSAGGHIAGCTAIPTAPDADTDDLSVSCIPNGLLLCYPVATLVEDSRSARFRRAFGDDMALRISPASHVTQDWPPTIQFYGTVDRLLPGGALLRNRAREAGVPSELYLAEGEPHAFDGKAPWHIVTSKYAAKFFMAAGIFDKSELPEAPDNELRRYDGEPVDQDMVTPDDDARRKLRDERKRKEQAKSP